ncbi:hypothetical protein M0R72_21690 [Candidatus Pacearchaeota archaeon]|nr:hypothetical protein [Candidatus Pacearchaeota archaeon]
MRAEERAIAHDWQTAQLFGIAVNNPKEFPRLSKLLPNKAINKQKMKQEAANRGLRIP